MSQPVTEFAYIPVKPEATLEAEGTEPYQKWQETLKTISEQPGYRKLYWGRTLEKPDLVQLAVEWDSLDAHIAFTKTPIYGPFGQKLVSLTNDILILYHVEFQPITHPFFGTSGATEIVTWFNPSITFLENVRKFAEIVKQGKPEGMGDFAVGQTFEDDVSRDGRPGGKGKAVVLAIGWTSKEAHMKFRDTELFKENVGLIREGSGSDVTMHHTVFQAY